MLLLEHARKVPYLSTSCLTLVSRRHVHATLFFLLSSSTSSLPNSQDQMKPTKNSPKRTRPSSRNSPPRRGRVATFPSEPETSSSSLTSSATLLDQEAETLSAFDNLGISFDDNTAPSPNSNPRSFPYSVKQQCWDKAEKIKGRDPDRWRRDSLGNIVFRKLVGCPGCLCHDYDHILPYSKGGKSTLENCQVLQATVNRSKGNQTDISRAELIRRSSYCRVSGRDMDLLELSAFGNVRRAEDSGGGCIIQ